MVTVAFAILFVVVVVGLTALSIREQRQAGDTDQSNRAFAAAEAGIKDALSMLDVDANKTIGSCSDAEAHKNLDGPDYGYTCLTITQQPGDIDSRGDKDESKSAYVFMAGQPLPNGGGGDDKAWADHLNLYWSRKASGDKPPLSSLSGPLYPAYDGSTPWNQPAGVELTFIYWKVSNPINETSIDVASGSFDGNKSLMTKTFLIMPGQAGSNKDDGSPVHGIPPTPKIQSSCNIPLSGPTTPTLKKEYYCKLMQSGKASDGIDLRNIVFDGGDPKDYRFVFKLKPRYSATSYYAGFTAGTGPDKQTLVPATSALIDVTAKSGNLYKRLRAERSLETRARGTVFDSAVFSGTDICKNLSVDSSNNTKSYNTCD